MKNLTLLTLVVSFLVGSTTIFAQNTDPYTKFKNYLNNTVQKVESADDVEEKRTILENSLTDLTEAIKKVEKMAVVSEDDKAGLAELKDSIQEKRDELNGVNGFNRVKDGQLNNYANYIMQDFEQADKRITFSVTTLLIIIIILILI